MEIKSVLITGGYGNLGSWLTAYFVKKGYQVTTLAKKKRPILTELNVDFLACDIADERSCKQALSNKHFDLVLHTASVNDGFVEDYAELALKVNAWGTRNVLEAMKANCPKHFIYFSTFQVYGKYAGSIDEQTPLETKNDYGLTHLFAEGYVKKYGFTHKLPYSIIRLTNSYGAPKDLDSSKWYLILNDLSKAAFERREIILKSNGKAPRDFIWMGDVCEAIEKLGLHGPTLDTYNISGEHTLQMIDVAKYVQEAYLEDFNELLPIQTNQDDRTEFPEGLSVSSQKLRKIISFGSNEPKFKSEAKQIFNLLNKK